MIIFLCLFSLGSIGFLVPWLGQDFFPAVDSGQFKIHVRAHTGTRAEETAALCDHIDATIRSQIPTNELLTILDNIGLPNSPFNLAYSTSAPVGPSDADIQVQLNTNHHPTQAYVEKIRAALAREYPGVTFYVLPVDIVTQILNFGLAAPIDLQIQGNNLNANHALAERMLNEIRYVPGATDARIQQPFNNPNWTINVDRTQAGDVGLTQQNVAQSVLVALSGSFQTAPAFFSRPQKRRDLQRCHPDAPIPPQLAVCTQKPPNNRDGRLAAAGQRDLHRGARLQYRQRARRSHQQRSRRSQADAGTGQPGHSRARERAG